MSDCGDEEPPVDDVVIDESEPLDDDEKEDTESSESGDSADESDTIVEVPEDPGQLAIAKQLVPADQRTTMPVLTKYERAKIVGVRAQLIDEGSPLLIDAPPGVTHPVQLALAELRAGKCPIMLKRVFGDGSYEEWWVREMVVIE